MLKSDLKITSKTILVPAPTEIIANSAGKLIDIVFVIINTISCVVIIILKI